MAIIQQHLLHPIGESFVLTFANTVNGREQHSGDFDIDDSGNIYVCIADNEEANALKIGSDGNIIWRKRITDEDDSSRSTAIAVDKSSGDVYFIGKTYANLQYFTVGYQLMIGKYNSSGVRQWLKIFGDGYQRRAWSSIDDCLEPMWKAAFIPKASKYLRTTAAKASLTSNNFLNLFTII